MKLNNGKLNNSLEIMTMTDKRNLFEELKDGLKEFRDKPQ